MSDTITGHEVMRTRHCTQRNEGLTLVEVTIAISVFTVIALAVGFTLMRGMEYHRESADLYRGMNAVRDLIAEVQDIANRPQNLPAQEGIGAVYARYHNRTTTIADLDSGQIVTTCYPNEAAIPSILGGNQDLNFDGDASDNLGNASNGTDLKLVPMQFVLTFGTGNDAQTLTMYRLVTKTTD